jgi:hypothetical protein
LPSRAVAMKPGRTCNGTLLMLSTFQETLEKTSPFQEAAGP